MNSTTGGLQLKALPVRGSIDEKLSWGLYEQVKKAPSPPVSQFNSRGHGLSVLRTSFPNVIFRQPNCGSGDFTYECFHNWDRAELPADHEYGNTSHGVAIDSQHRVYITHNGNPGSLFVFDADGRFIRAMGEVHNAGPAAKGHGISFREDGGEEFLYLAPADSERVSPRCR